MQKKTNSYDQIKGMLKTLRTINESNYPKKSLNEDATPLMGRENDSEVDDSEKDFIIVNDVEVNMLSTDKNDLKLTDEQKTSISSLIDNFRNQVSRIVDFDPGITMDERQIRLDGTLTDNDISFVLIAGNEGGLYINADMLKIDDEVTTILDKLSKFEQPFKDAMEPIINERMTNVK